VGGGVFSGEVGGRSVQATFAGTYYNEVQGAQSGKPIGVRGWVQYDAANRQYYGNVTVTIGQHTNVSLYMRAVLEGTIDQSAPLPPANVSNAPVLSQIPNCGPGQELWARGTETSPPYRPFDFQVPVSDLQNWLRNNPSLRASTTTFYCRSNPATVNAPLPGRAPQGSSRMGPVWPVGMPAAVARTRLRGVYGLNTGVGAAGASAFTMAAAQALNDHLVTNNCAGCNDMTSQLRQLTFAFKAAVMTDTGISPQMNLNMSNALAMTAYGSGTDQALKNILGAAGVYANGPCTDDNGNCLGNLSTPVVPPATAALEQQVVKAIQAAIQQAPYIPQPELVKSLVQGFAALVNQIGFELAKLKPVIFVDNQPPAKPPPAPPPAAPPEKKIPWGTVLLGGLIGTAVLGTGVLLYTHARHS
jgi:hypothetical protein